MADATTPKPVLPSDVVEVDGEPDVGPSVLAVFGTEAQRRQARSLGIVSDEPDESGEQPPLP